MATTWLRTSPPTQTPKAPEQRGDDEVAPQHVGEVGDAERRLVARGEDQRADEP